MNSSVQAALQLIRLWLEARLGLAVRKHSGQCLLAVHPEGSTIKLPRAELEPRILVLIDSSRWDQTSPPFGDQRYTTIHLQSSLKEQHPSTSGDAVHLKLLDVIADLQDWTINEPDSNALLRLTPPGDLWSYFLKDLGYRSHQVPLERKTWHVVPDDQGWTLKAQSSDHPTSRYQTKEEAVQAGVDIARKVELGQLIIHRRDGTFEEGRAYS